MYHRVFDRIDAVVGEQVWNFADFATAPGRHARRRQQEGRVHPRPAAEGRGAPLRAAGESTDDAARAASVKLAPSTSATPPATCEQPDVLDGLVVPAHLLHRRRGISAATAGTLFLVVRVWGGITDLFAGRLRRRHLHPLGQVPPLPAVRLGCRCCCCSSPSSRSRAD